MRPMSESRLQYTVCFASRAQAAANLPTPEQARVLGTMLGT